MIETSTAYQELVRSNARPKCEPVIKIYNDNNKVAYEWRGKNIKDLKFNRSIDPISRELPYMELTWTEIYKGKLNENGFADKYKNASALMEVELSFEQTLGFFNSWQNVLDKYGTWQSVKDSGKTWKQIFRESSVEIITMPKMYLSVQPTLKNSIITWTARDILFFLNQQQFKEFAEGESGEFKDYASVVNWVLVDARSNYLNNKSFFYALQTTIQKIKEKIFSYETFKHQIYKSFLLDNTVKNNLLNLANLKTMYWNFKDNYMSFDSIYRITDSGVSVHHLFTDISSPYTYTKKLIYGYPEITPISNISSYEFKVYKKEPGALASEDEEYGNYILNFPENKINVNNIGNGVSSDKTSLFISTWKFRGIGNGKIETVSNEFSLNDTDTLISNRSSDTPVFVYPYEYKSETEKIIIENVSGEQYTEDNPLNNSGKNNKSEFAQTKIEALKLYFNDSLSNIEFNALPNLSLEPGDGCYVETNLFDDEDNRITKPCLIVRNEITYNGALKSKIYAHELEGTATDV